MSIEYCLFETPLGHCAIAWKAGAKTSIVMLGLPEANAAETEARTAALTAAMPAQPPSDVAAVIERVCQHLAGESQDFSDVVLEPLGVGSFGKAVLEAARSIPAGETITYGELAAWVGKPGAARAVGQALGRNPIPIIIPCHRILAAGGKPGGFSAHGGLLTKARLLKLEGASLKPGRQAALV